MLTKRQTLQIAAGIFILGGFVAALFIVLEVQAGKALGASPYPPPGESAVITTTPVPYPAPGEISQTSVTVTNVKRCDDLKSQLPTDHVVAVSSDC